MIGDGPALGFERQALVVPALETAGSGSDDGGVTFHEGGSVAAAPANVCTGG